jgi:hypothetical protein
MTMALAGTLLAGVAVLAQAQTPQVSAQEVTVKLKSAMSKEHSLIDNRRKLKAAYKTDSKSPETQKLTREFCGDWLASNTEYEAAHDAWVWYIQHPPFVPEERDKLWHLNKQTDALGSESFQLGDDLFAMGVTCPGVNTTEPTAKPSAKNPIEGQMTLVAVFVVGLVLYFLPSVVGNRKRNRWTIFTLNLLAGWTIVGWIVAMVWASSPEASEKPALSHSANNVMGQKAFCGHCGSPVTTEFCRNCGRRAAL